MNPSKSPSKPGPSKSALGSLLLSEKSLKPSNRSALVPPVLQQVGKLAAGVANVATEYPSSGSATGNPRNKVALQPGHSLMDWIRLGASGRDLTGVGSKAGHLAVTKQELSRHNKLEDIWIAVRDKVYNVTAYIPFHPGGPEELMRAAGIDATRLFDQVHPWVNYDQILQKCFVGRVVASDSSITVDDIFGKPVSPFKSPLLKPNENIPEIQATEHSPTHFPNKSDSSKNIDLFEKEDFNSDKLPFESSKVARSSSDVAKEVTDDLQSRVRLPPRFDWIQKLDSITIIFYTKAFANPMIEIYPPAANHAIKILFNYDETVFENELVFYDEVHWPCSTRVSYETGKVEMTFRKQESGVWENYGRLKQRSNDAEAVNSGVKFNFVYKNKVKVTHNIFLLELERTDGAKIVVPIGKHVRACVNVDGKECCRSYTPVPKLLFSTLSTNASTSDIICLMVKRYENGNVSCYLTSRERDDVVYLSSSMGDIDLKRVEKKEVFLLLAAGTGITPMFALLLFLLERRVKRCQFLRLLFFNRTEQDIPFRTQLDSLADADSRFKVDHILSEPGDDWTGLTGHINKEMIENSLLEHIKDTGYTIRDTFVFICGPNVFLTKAVEDLIQLEFLDEQIHTFQG